MSPQRVFAVLLLATFVIGSALPAPAAAALHDCGTDLKTIQLGTGDLLTDQAGLHSVNHWDLVVPADCREGRIAFEPATTSMSIKWKAVCSENIIRVFADAGAVNAVFQIYWLKDGTSPCAGSSGGGGDDDDPDGPDEPPQVPPEVPSVPEAPPLPPP